ncbi:hypothetical protein G4B88_024139 [Cannabis sativa]|uniref:Uncharacterized protein n=1 Tax=Cannabis sativa TaxID=3483 RepID=A0A7J6H546_CANSA|nr:hypothetical protein G4B88_024139 [Cannabis sativa]
MNPQIISNNIGSMKYRKQCHGKSGGREKKTLESNSSFKCCPANGKKTLNCWLCQGPHMVDAYPHQSKLSAIKASISQEDSSKSKETPGSQASFYPATKEGSEEEETKFCHCICQVR